MALSVKSTGKLAQFALRLREAPKKIQQKAATEIKAGVTKLIADEFATKTDPYGKAWRPPQDGGETMVRSGKARRGFRVEVVPGGVGLSLRISNAQDYVKWLQKGTSVMEARRTVPDGAMPERWKKVFADAYDRAIAAWYATVKF